MSLLHDLSDALTVNVKKSIIKGTFFKIETVKDEWYITFNHEMTKEHHLPFIAYVGYDLVLIVRLYPEQGGEVHFPNLYGQKIYFCCNKHGL